MEALRTYLLGKRKGEFARKVGISPAYLSQILSKKNQKRPSFQLMVEIDRQTGGEVPVSSWVSDCQASSSRFGEAAE